jgi:ATP-dependent Lon protease
MSESSDTKPGKPKVGPKITVPLLPLRDIIIFPATIVPLFVGRDKSIRALEQAMEEKKEIFLVAQKKAKTTDPTSDDLYDIGTLANILQLLRLPDGTVKVLVEGKKRAKVLKFVKKDDYYIVEAVVLEEKKQGGLENEAILRTVKMSFDNYVRLNKRIPAELLLSISQIEDESKLADTLVSHLGQLKLEAKQKLLEETSPRARLEQVYGLIQSEIEIMRVEKKIRARVKRQMEKTQKEYYLNEQITAIQKELGEKDDSRSELREMEAQLKKVKLSEEAAQKIGKEIKKLKSMSSMSAEATVVRNYIETVLSLPWQSYSEDIKNIVYAEEVLNRDHFGLDKVKDRILEYLSIRNIVETMKGPILCIVGPPGVGKTSLARSVAEALNRKYVRISLGGVKDQAEIRGHRKTYIGSMPGKIVMALKRVGSANPVILLDEIDKMGNDYRGDPAAAMLEVLDPEQNRTFNDHYLDLDFDLSHCLFIATANSTDGIPAPLLDRMELIRIAGYTEDEKIQIAQKYLVVKQLKEHGLEKSGLTFHPSAITELIRYYTREAGVRSLEREIASLVRKTARCHLKDHTATIESVQPIKAGSKKAEESLPAIAGEQLVICEEITSKSVEKYLGPQRFRFSPQSDQDEVGVCTGLAWTAVGGELLLIEVAILPGKGKLTITGKLGDVMQESAQAALSYVRSRAKFLGLAEDFYQHLDIHIHVPEGAIPKDGPSAGLTMATALTSALTQRPINKNVAMTGEITLRGRSLAIGGLKEKALAAHRSGITTVIFPRENLKDLHEIPEAIRKTLTFIPVDHMDEVLMHALAWNKAKDKKPEDELLRKLMNITRTLREGEYLPGSLPS